MPKSSCPPSTTQRALGLLSITAALATLPACAVVDLAASVGSAAISVTSAVVSTGVSVTGKVVEKAIDVAAPDEQP